MELEGSLPHSQQPATCLDSQPDKSIALLPNRLPYDPLQYYNPIYSNFFQVVSFPKFPHQTLFTTPPLRTCHMHRPSNTLFDHPDNIL
jgi:hypothetical protein